MITQTTILEYIPQLQNALRTIAGQCDGAREDDGVGFNGCDAGIGRDFARLPRLSFGQAIYAAKMLKKYRRTQLGGMPLPTVAEVEVAILAYKQSFKVSLHEDRVIVEFPYNAQIKAALDPLKNCGGRFNLLGKKEWSYPVQRVNTVLNKLRPFAEKFYVEAAVLEAEERQRQIQREQFVYC